MKITPMTIVLVVALTTLIGPLTSLADMPSGALTDLDWLQSVGEEAVRGFATGALSAITVVAGAYGIDVRSRMKGNGGTDGDRA